MTKRLLQCCIGTIVGLLLLAFGQAALGAPDVAGLRAALALPLCRDTRLGQDIWEVNAGDGVTINWNGLPAAAASAQVVVYQVGLPDWGTLQFMLHPYRGYSRGNDALFGAMTGGDFYASPDGLTRSFLSGDPGVYNLFTVFYNAQGKPDCRTRHSWLMVGARVVRYVDPCGVVRIVVLIGSPYGGAYDVLVNGDTYTGDGACEVIHGNNNGNLIDGGDGNDTIFGYDGDDLIYGGSGNDIIDAGNNNDTVYGGSENNPGETSGDGNDVIEGGNGTDVIYGGNNNNGGAGNDGSDVITDSAGDGDQLVGGNNNNGGTGDDSHDSLTDSAGNNDTLIGGNTNDLGSGSDGSDHITDSAGNNDTLIGGNQNTNSSTGNDGSDHITDSGGANDQVYGGNANDIGSSGNDNADGGGDQMTSIDGSGGDTIVGGNNNPATGSDGAGDSASCELVLGDNCTAGVP